MLGKFKRYLLGRPLASYVMHEEKIPKWKALAVLSSDALSSVAYATEEILIPLAMFSVAATAYSLPVALAIVCLLLIVAASYRQTISVYFSGGGAYVVAKENLGIYPGLVAAASLMIDYVLTVAVSIAASVGALISAFPDLAAHKILIASLLMLIITVLNLRGIRESATAFVYPTYLFIFSFFILLGVGGWNLLTGNIQAVHPVVNEVYPAIPIILVLRAFSSGCAALTGIEAISNSVPNFKVPSEKNARATMLYMACILAVLFFGITALSHAYGILPSANETAVSQLARSIFGTSWFYYTIQIVTVAILVLAANASYAGFPWLAAVLAKDRYLPRQLAGRGDKLVFSNSIIGLGITALLLIIGFKADTHHLIPLYAVGVFMGFTLSQTGMLKYHVKHRQPGWKYGFVINCVGAIATFIVMLVIAITKFTSGAWIVIILIPLIMGMFLKIHKHYMEFRDSLDMANKEVRSELLAPVSHTVIVPVSGVHRGVLEALRYANSIGDDVRACYVEIDPVETDYIREQWRKWAPNIPLVILSSPFRSIIRPLLEYIDEMEEVIKDDILTIVIPEFVTEVWWQTLLHNQTAFFIRAALFFREGKVVTAVRYHIRGRGKFAPDALSPS